MKKRQTIAVVVATALIMSMSGFVRAQDAIHADSMNTAGKHLSFGQRYHRAKSFEDAETQLMKSLDYNPGEGRAAYYLGRVYNDTERYEEAVEWFTKAIELLPADNVSHKNAYYYLGQIHFYLENRPEAISAYQKLLTLSPKREREIQYLHSLVSLSAEEEDFKAALEYARLWGVIEPDNPEVREMIATLAMHTGGAEEALVEKEKVLEMNPNDWETLEWLGNQYKQQGDMKKSFDSFTKLHEHDPTNFAYLDNLFGLSQELSKLSSLGIPVGSPDSWPGLALAARISTIAISAACPSVAYSPPARSSSRLPFSAIRFHQRLGRSTTRFDGSSCLSCCDGSRRRG